MKVDEDIKYKNTATVQKDMSYIKFNVKLTIRRKLFNKRKSFTNVLIKRNRINVNK